MMRCPLAVASACFTNCARWSSPSKRTPLPPDSMARRVSSDEEAVWRFTLRMKFLLSLDPGASPEHMFEVAPDHLAVPLGGTDKRPRQEGETTQQGAAA